MSDKYIIRNCPAFVLMRTATSGTYFDMCGNAKGHIKCADRTDCVLKQIVKITKNYTKGCGKHCDINRKENNCGKTCNAYKIRQILELLDIQECKND